VGFKLKQNRFISISTPNEWRGPSVSQNILIDVDADGADVQGADLRVTSMLFFQRDSAAQFVERSGVKPDDAGMEFFRETFSGSEIAAATPHTTLSPRLMSIPYSSPTQSPQTWK